MFSCIRISTGLSFSSSLSLLAITFRIDNQSHNDRCQQRSEHKRTTCTITVMTISHHAMNRNKCNDA